MKNLLLQCAKLASVRSAAVVSTKQLSKSRNWAFQLQSSSPRKILCELLFLVRRNLTSCPRLTKSGVVSATVSYGGYVMITWAIPHLENDFGSRMMNTSRRPRLFPMQKRRDELFLLIQIKVKKMRDTSPIGSVHNCPLLFQRRLEYPGKILRLLMPDCSDKIVEPVAGARITFLPCLWGQASFALRGRYIGRHRRDRKEALGWSWHTTRKLELCEQWIFPAGNGAHLPAPRL